LAGFTLTQCGLLSGFLATSTNAYLVIAVLIDIKITSRYSSCREDDTENLILSGRFINCLSFYL